MNCALTSPPQHRRIRRAFQGRRTLKNRVQFVHPIPSENVL